MGNIGKIGRLPVAIREELNRRLQDNRPGDELLEWLNALPEMKSTLAKEFDGQPISQQNLSNWKCGGYRRWEREQEAVRVAGEAASASSAVRAAAKGSLGDQLATMLTARYAALLSEWEGGLADEKSLESLRALCVDVVRLRRGDHSERRVKVMEGDNQGVSQSEILEYFYRWAQHPRIKEWICDGETRPAMKKLALRRIFGGDVASGPEGGTGKCGCANKAEQG